MEGGWGQSENQDERWEMKGEGWRDGRYGTGGREEKRDWELGEMDRCRGGGGRGNEDCEPDPEFE